MRRIWVAGTSGSGKTTLAAEIARTLDVPHVELDALWWGPGWTPRPDFPDTVARALAQDAWVACGNHRGTDAGPLLRARADTLVWLDLPRATVMRRVTLRTIRRIVTREPLWAGNRERLRSQLRPDGIVRWAWSTHEANRQSYAGASTDPELAHLTVHRIRCDDDLRTFRDHLAAG